MTVIQNDIISHDRWNSRRVPGHGPSLQVCLSKSNPLHVFPPFCGVGLVQVRSRIIDPDPQVTEQALEPAQDDQPPSTVSRAESEICICKSAWLKTSVYLMHDLKYNDLAFNWDPKPPLSYLGCNDPPNDFQIVT